MKLHTRPRALRINFADNVAVAMHDLSKGELVPIADRDGTIFELNLLEPVPFAHKLAVKKIKAGQKILKYGESIGVATAEISAGQHVHTHNVVSRRAARKK